MIDSQMDDMIKEKLALKEQVDSLEPNLSKQIKEKECLLQTFTVFKNESKEKENKYIENEIDLEKKIKELDNIIFKVGQSGQTVHIKPPDASLVKIEAPKELPTVSLVNESLKKLKFHLARFENVVKIRTTPDARIEAELQDKDTTICKLKDIIKSMREKSKEVNVNYNYGEIETKKVELKNSVAKLILENKRLANEINHVKQKSMFDGVHDMCLLDFVENVNSRAKSAKKHKKQNIWKPTGHVFTEVGLKWKPTGRTFTIVGNSCPLTRITSANVVPPKKTTSHSVETQKPELKVYSRKPKNVKNVGSSKKAKIVESKNANHSEPNHTWGSNATDIPSSSSLIMTGCPDCSLVSGLQMFKTYDREPLSAHEQSSRLACALGKIKKSSHQPKAEDINQEKLYLLHMDLCGPMRVASINGKRYILVIVDDYSRFTWVKFLRTKDEAPEAIIKCIKNIQVRLNATVRNVRTDNRTEFLNQTLREFYENVGISHQTSVSRTPQQNGIVERRNRTLLEAARTMLLFSKAPLFLWAKAINTACYTQNRSLICLRYNKIPYELMQDTKPDLSFFHVFGALCYSTNDDLSKLDAKADIGIFVGYAPAKKAFRIYNKRTQKIIETIHVTFDELTAMASEQFSSGPGVTPPKWVAAKYRYPGRVTS
ncbi:retrovirus-related pol polyprotein from transposon TNT 1-94 [Tanacetum coccineum]